MNPQMKVLMFAGPLFLLVLVAVAGYAYSQVRRLSLPIPEALAILTVLYPLVTGFSSLAIPRLLTLGSRGASSAAGGSSSHHQALTVPNLPPQPQQFAITLTLRLILILQLIYGISIGTLSLSYAVPSVVQACSLNEAWMAMFRARDERGIRAIQQHFECCGFNTVRDRAWPFQSQSIDAGECGRRFGWDVPCGGVWGRAERVNAGRLFGVVVGVFVVKFVAMIIVMRGGEAGAVVADAESSSYSWVRPPSHRRGMITTRRLIDDECASEDPETGNEHYRDEGEVPGAAATAVDETNDNNGGRPRVEPSGLLPSITENGEQWR